MQEKEYQATTSRQSATPAWWRTTAVVASGCLISLTTYGLRTSFGLFAEPISEGRASVFAEPFHQGRAQQLWVVTICDERERQLARGQVRE